ncbi:MAG: hypothetical protein J3Q66DRAFT_354572 [Benniella sp.]|nr:MAG: hypothetical protein J3Q66DRAFT_354572 [Benniella sp.]
MSRNVSFEDPLLNPSTLSISVAPASQTQKEPEHTQARRSLQVDDGPIPFQTTSSDTSSIFSPPPFPAQAKAVDFTGQEGTHEKAELGAAKANPGFVDPLTAALQSQGDDNSMTPQAAGAGAGAIENKRISTRIASPNINTANSTMPSEFPTHLASPPLPQRPSATFSPAHPPLTTSGIHVPSSLDSGTSFDGGVANRTLESTDINPPPQVPSVGFSGSKRSDSTDMVNQDLKSPVQEGSGRHFFHGTSLHSAQSSMSGPPGSPLQIRPVVQERESFVG